MKQLIWILLACLPFGWTACNDKDNTVMAEEGIVFSPATAYQEAYPGSIINFKVRVRTHETITRFGLRFQLPGSSAFVALPEYPDQEGDAAASFSGFREVEYALPASTDTIDTSLRLQFVAATATNIFEKEFVIRLKSAGRQQLRLYNPAWSNYFRFDALDLRAGKGVDAGDQQVIQDLAATTTEIKVPVSNTSFQAIRGWEGMNGATFKVVTAASYNDSVHKYPAIYKAIAAASELNGVSSMLTATTNKIGALTTNNPYYIAKVKRDAAEYYIGIMVKKYPPVNAGNSSAATQPDSLNEYIQLEIKQ